MNALCSLCAAIPIVAGAASGQAGQVRVIDTGYEVRPITHGAHVGEAIVSRSIAVQTGACQFHFSHHIRADGSAPGGVAPVSPSATLGLSTPWPAGFSNGNFLYLSVRPPGGPSVLGATLPKMHVTHTSERAAVRMDWVTDTVKATTRFVCRAGDRRLWMQLDAQPTGNRRATWSLACYPMRFAQDGTRVVTTGAQTAAAGKRLSPSAGESWAVYYDRAYDSDRRRNTSGPSVLVWDRARNVDSVGIDVGTYSISTQFRFGPSQGARLRCVLWQHPKEVGSREVIQRTRAEGATVLEQLRRMAF